MTNISQVDELLERGGHPDIATLAIIGLTDDRFIVVRMTQMFTHPGEKEEFLFSAWALTLDYSDEESDDPKIVWEPQEIGSGNNYANVMLRVTLIIGSL